MFDRLHPTTQLGRVDLVSPHCRHDDLEFGLELFLQPDRVVAGLPPILDPLLQSADQFVDVDLIQETLRRSADRIPGHFIESSVPSPRQAKADTEIVKLNDRLVCWRLMASGTGVIFVGGGGHAAVCRDVFESNGQGIRGYVAPQPSDIDLDYLGDDGALAELARRHSAEVFVAIGSNVLRSELLARVRKLGLRAATAIDRTAHLSRSVTVGCGTVVMPGAVINARTTIGDGVIVNTSASIDHDGVLEPMCHVGPGAHLAGGVRIGRGAFLGVGVSVIPGCVIGEWSTIGAGAAVVNEIAPHVLAYGVPARNARTLDAARRTSDD